MKLIERHAAHHSTFTAMWSSFEVCVMKVVDNLDCCIELTQRLCKICAQQRHLGRPVKVVV